jgi:hypothetical protein
LNGGLIVLMMISFSLNFLTFQILTDFSGFSVNMDGYVPLVSEKRSFTHLYVGSVPREPLFSEPPPPPSAMAEQKVSRLWAYFLALSESSALSAIRAAVITLFLRRKWIWLNLMG